MKRLFILGSALLLAVALLISCSDQRPLAPTETTEDASGNQAFVDPEAVALALAEQAGWPVEADVETVGERGHIVLDFEREVVVGNIAHYSLKLRIGPGEYDYIGLHRVVKERRPGRPIRTPKTLFCLHGTPGHFEAMFLFGSMCSAPDDQSIAAFLAQNDVDVWGIDQAATLLPAEIADFSFMQAWGLGFDAQNLRTGMAVARIARGLTGSGFGKLNLLGYSTGLMTGFAALDMETQLPSYQRQIGGFIPVDWWLKTDVPEEQESACAEAAGVAEMLAAGVYEEQSGMLFQTLGFLAQIDPEGDSPIIPGFTNTQAVLFAGALTSVVFGLAGDFHFVAGVFDEYGMPTDLNYTDYGQFIEWLQCFNNYNSNVHAYDIAVVHCDQEDSPFDDHLAEIGVPIFFLGANGGSGGIMDYTASLLTGVDDLTLLNVSLQPAPILDIGHIDIFTAGVSQVEFWHPVLDWIEAH